jgi:hypothetical protein
VPGLHPSASVAESRDDLSPLVRNYLNAFKSQDKKRDLSKSYGRWLIPSTPGFSMAVKWGQARHCVPFPEKECFKRAFAL